MEKSRKTVAIFLLLFTGRVISTESVERAVLTVNDPRLTLVRLGPNDSRANLFLFELNYLVSLYEISNRINCKFILFLYLIFPIIQLISYNLFEYTTWRIPPLRIFFLIYSSMATRSTGCYAKLDRSIYFSFAYSIDSDYAKNISSARDRAIVRRIYPAIIHVERATCDESNDTRRRQMEMTRLARCFVDEPLLRRGKRFEAKTWKRDGRPV